jgi:superfamily II DNA or RNA helicase
VNNLEKITDLLSTLGVASLSGYIGKNNLHHISEAEFSIEATFLSEILLIERGFSIFKDKNIRLELLGGLGKAELKRILLMDDFTIEDLKKFNSFSWGNNKNSVRFLDLFNIGSEVLESDNKDLPPILRTNINRPLYKYQNLIRKKISHFLWNSEKDRAIVHMPTGAGKTRTMLESACDYMRSIKCSNYVVVWLAHSEELCEQAVSSFNEIWSALGDEDANIIRMWGGQNTNNIDITGPTFIVTSFQTASNMLSTNTDVRFENFSKIKNNCKLLIVDEAHQSTAPTYKNVISLFSRHETKVVGLTATPGRHHVGQAEDETKILADFYNNNKINIVNDTGDEIDNPIDFLTKKGVLAKATKFTINSPSEISLNDKEMRQMERYLDIPVSVLKKLGEDSIRTNLIVAQAVKLNLDLDFPTIIFAPSKDSAITIAILIKLRGVDAAAVTGDTPTYQRRQSISDFKEGRLPILVNFGVLTTGFDAPNIKAVVIARPTTSVVLYSQMIGRGLRGRLMGGTDECYLIDVKDNIINMPDADQAFVYFDDFY